MRRIGIESLFIADQNQIFSLSLSNQHAVERIPVRSGQLSGAKGVFQANSERLKSKHLKTLRQFCGKECRSGELSDAHLRRDFPRRGSAHEDFRGKRLEQRTRLHGDPFRIKIGPQ